MKRDRCGLKLLLTLACDGLHRALLSPQPPSALSGRSCLVPSPGLAGHKAPLRIWQSCRGCMKEHRNLGDSGERDWATVAEAETSGRGLQDVGDADPCACLLAASTWDSGRLVQGVTNPLHGREAMGTVQGLASLHPCHPHGPRTMNRAE